MNIYEVGKDDALYSIMRSLISQSHQHLAEANILLYKYDKVKVSGNNIIFAKASKAAAQLKASTAADFTITFYQTFGDIRETQKKACLDHELSHCEVIYEPQKEDGKVLKDDYGRPIPSREIKRDEEGKPKWKLIPHDLEEFRDIVRRHGIWDDSIQAFKIALDAVEENSE